jgi:hypothetical protein
MKPHSLVNESAPETSSIAIYVLYLAGGQSDLFL